MRNQKSRTPLVEIPMKSEKSRTLNLEVIQIRGIKFSLEQILRDLIFGQKVL